MGAPVRLGFANLFVMCTLCYYGPWEAITVQVLRTFLGKLLIGSPFSLIYSMSAGILSCVVMILLYPLYRKEKVSIPGIAMAGAFVYNITQLAVGVLINGPAMMAYLPVLGLLSIPAGLFTGYLANLLVDRIKFSD